MVYGDDLSSDRVFKDRESIFASGVDLDSDGSDAELYHGKDSPLPDSLLAQRKQGKELPVRKQWQQIFAALHASDLHNELISNLCGAL
jgi:hypothetical protein